MRGPLALLTDFGLADPYVGVMKGVLAGLAPGVPVIDVTHGVPPQDVRLGALYLDAAWPWFPEGSVFVCVVDPSVGGPRRALVAEAAGRTFVGPDNGLLSLLPAATYVALRLPAVLPSRTFHGRDLFAPVAARLAMGGSAPDMGEPVVDVVRLVLPTPEGDVGEVLYVDVFGNAVTNLPGCDAGWIEVAGRRAPVGLTYGAVEVGETLAVTGSTGRLEIAIREGSAARELGIGPGTRVRVERG